MGPCSESGTWFVFLSAGPVDLRSAVRAAVPALRRAPDDGGTGMTANENAMQWKGTTDDTQKVLRGAGKNGARMMDLGLVDTFGIRRLVERAEIERSAGRMRTRGWME